uniref:MIT domain-containing protein n=1 Tax=Hydatigena taeniaeformis TaxID=6205 RepID=A0A0R3WMN2_HYDTA
LLAAEDTYEYAAVFALARAECEALNSDGHAEAAALMEAGRLFVRAEENLQTSSTLSSGELMEHAVSCFLKAAKLAYVSEDISALDTSASFMQPKINLSQRRILQDLLENAISPPDDIL